jgi:hypothetical protein
MDTPSRSPTTFTDTGRGGDHAAQIVTMERSAREVVALVRDGA